jgi:hypothetical protein
MKERGIRGRCLCSSNRSSSTGRAVAQRRLLVPLAAAGCQPTRQASARHLCDTCMTAWLSAASVGLSCSSCQPAKRTTCWTSSRLYQVGEQLAIWLSVTMSVNGLNTLW